MLGSSCLVGVLGLAGVLVSCWGLFVLLGSWCGPGGLATITPPTTFVIDFRAVISMYLGGVISGPKDGVISDRNLRTRRQNELRQNGVFNLTVAAAGPRVATRIRRSNRFSLVPPRRLGSFPHCLQWPPSGERRFSDAPAGAKVDFVSRWGPRWPFHLLALYGVFSQKCNFTKPRGEG